MKTKDKDKKGDSPTAFQSLESEASDPYPPEYIFEGPGELVAIKGEHGQVRWRQPVPDVWLKMDQLEPWA